MFFGFINPSSAGSAPANLTFASRRTGRDRRADVRDMQARMAALDHAQALVELTLDGKVFDVNENFLALLETTADAILGQPYTALLTEAERNRPVFRQFQDKALRGEPATARLSHVTRSKGSVDLRIGVVPVMGDDGKLARLFGVATDETEIARNNSAGSHAAAALDNVSVAVMMVNRDFIVTDVNKATQDLLTRSADRFRKLWPTFDPAKIVGSCIDMFHRDPQHQRRMLSDPSRLPFRTEINVGGAKFALNVSARYDCDGNYDGNILEWTDVTERHNQLGQLAAINRPRREIVHVIVPWGICSCGINGVRAPRRARWPIRRGVRPAG